MSSLIYVECKPADATCVQCHDCEREELPFASYNHDDDCKICDGRFRRSPECLATEKHGSFYDGPAEMAAHDADYPEHRRLTWLRKEIV